MTTADDGDKGKDPTVYVTHPEARSHGNLSGSNSCAMKSTSCRAARSKILAAIESKTGKKVKMVASRG